ncbi:MAG: flavin reductase family protein [Henriciella sp.]|jgi:flavin reductase (DIM6/NTAB) family NADH-FMN oxidoreductase RutF|nr:flavin reductase family protein [Henriciella sp.]
MTFDIRAFRDTLGLFVTGVTVITTVTEQGDPVGITANSFNSVSLDPPLVLWSVGQNSRSLSAFEQAEHFAVHILREDQAELSQRFAKSGADKFENLALEAGASNIPLLKDCAARLECTRYSHHEAGDHIIFVAKVERLASDPDAMPLVYHGGRYAELSDKPLTPAY